MFVGDNASEKITAIQLFRLLLELLFGERFNFILKRLYLNTRFYEDEILIKWFNFLKKSIYMDAYEKKQPPIMEKYTVYKVYPKICN